MWISGSLDRDQFNLLIANGGYPKLPDYLHGGLPGSKYIVVGQKAYAAYSSSGRRATSRSLLAAATSTATGTA